MQHMRVTTSLHTIVGDGLKQTDSQSGGMNLAAYRKLGIVCTMQHMRVRASLHTIVGDGLKQTDMTTQHNTTQHHNALKLEWHPKK